MLSVTRIKREYSDSTALNYADICSPTNGSVAHETEELTGKKRKVSITDTDENNEEYVLRTETAPTASPEIANDSSSCSPYTPTVHATSNTVQRQYFPSLNNYFMGQEVVQYSNIHSQQVPYGFSQSAINYTDPVECSNGVIRNQQWDTLPLLTTRDRSFFENSDSFVHSMDNPLELDQVNGCCKQLQPYFGFQFAPSRQVATNRINIVPGIDTEVFCQVPGRNSLLSSATKYSVTIGEIFRRISPPECLNASLLGGLLRKAKAKNGGNSLREQLSKHGIHLPIGRRKTTEITPWTALVEEEAFCMAKSFTEICQKNFPVVELADHLFEKDCLENVDSRLHISKLEITSSFIREILHTLNVSQNGIFQAKSAFSLSSKLQNLLTHFSLLTHGFGNFAFVAVLECILSIFEAQLKLCHDRSESTANQFSNSYALNSQVINRPFYLRRGLPSIAQGSVENSNFRNPDLPTKY